MDYCPECNGDNLTEHEEYFECEDCGAQFEVDSDPDDPEPYEPYEY